MLEVGGGQHEDLRTFPLHIVCRNLAKMFMASGCLWSIP